MKKIILTLSLALFAFAVAVGRNKQISGQTSGSSAQAVYFGVGLGLDYGGLGAKLEYLPVKYFGLFAGFGYNSASAGYNIGATWKITPDKTVSFNPMVFYGYNAVLKIEGKLQYDAISISYGPSLGANLDIKIGAQKKNKISIGLFYPIRSKSFMDKYDAANNNPYVEWRSELMPVGYSIGINFKL